MRTRSQVAKILWFDGVRFWGRLHVSIGVAVGFVLNKMEQYVFFSILDIYNCMYMFGI